MAKELNKTKEFLKKCKEAGYERITIFIRDKRIPATMEIKDGAYWGEIANAPPKVICGHPPQRGTHPDLPGDKWPKMWGIVKEFGLTAGLSFGGFGLGDAHDIHPALCGLLTAGYYDLQTSI